ncbi:MAG: CmcJ/NvfI family oxidoreductase, partial [Pseudomonadota bacterium]
MTHTTTVNYHVYVPGRQAHHIDTGGVEGRVISPRHAVTDVCVTYVRYSGEVRLEVDSVEYFTAPSQVRLFNDGGAWQAVYDRKLADLLVREHAAEEVIVFDYTVRAYDPNASRKLARNVHSDYNPKGAQHRLIDILGSKTAKVWSEGHYGFINVWRLVEHPINSAPLGFVRPTSVAVQTWLMLELIYPSRRGHIMGLVVNQDTDWIYQSKMAPDEVDVFNNCDNRGKPSIAHSAPSLTGKSSR